MKFNMKLYNRVKCKIYEPEHAARVSIFSTCDAIVTTQQKCHFNIPDKKRNAPLRTVQLSGKSQVIGQLSLHQCKGMSVTAASHVFCNQASKLC